MITSHIVILRQYYETYSREGYLDTRPASLSSSKPKDYRHQTHGDPCGIPANRLDNHNNIYYIMS